MIAYRMRKIPATNCKGTRIKVIELQSSQSKIYPYPYECSGIDAIFTFLTGLNVIRSFADNTVTKCDWIVIVESEGN